MRFEASVTSVSWIPSQSVSGLYKAGFAVGASHADDPPPEVIANVADLDELFAAGGFRFANRLTAWIEVADGQVVDAIRKLAAGALLAEQGDPGGDLYLLMDGVLSVAVNGTQVGEIGPGALVGERSLLEDGRRTATLRAVTRCVIATAAADQIDRDGLASLAELHRREDAGAQRG